jgi:hypothetical protein
MAALAVGWGGGGARPVSVLRRSFACFCVVTAHPAPRAESAIPSPVPSGSRGRRASRVASRLPSAPFARIRYATLTPRVAVTRSGSFLGSVVGRSGMRTNDRKRKLKKKKPRPDIRVHATCTPGPGVAWQARHRAGRWRGARSRGPVRAVSIRASRRDATRSRTTTGTAPTRDGRPARDRSSGPCWLRAPRPTSRPRHFRDRRPAQPLVGRHATARLPERDANEPDCQL